MSFVSPDNTLSANGAVEGKLVRKDARSDGDESGWKMDAGRSWSVTMGDWVMLYGGPSSERFMARVTVMLAVGAHCPSKHSYALDIATKGCDGPFVPERIVQP